MTNNSENAPNPPDDVSQYLQTFLDETEEQLDDLVETMLALERDATVPEDLNEAFRLIHSIKGSAGIMGLEGITVLTHHLETRFERFRSGKERLDERTMNLVLRCVDFLRHCNNRLRAGQPLDDPASLLGELRQLENAAPSPTDDAASTVGEPESKQPPAPLVSPAAPAGNMESVDDGLVRIVVQFRPGMPLVDLKAQLIVTRLSNLGDVQRTLPDLDQLDAFGDLDHFEVHIKTSADHSRLRDAVDVNGVEAIEITGDSEESISDVAAHTTSEPAEMQELTSPQHDGAIESSPDSTTTQQNGAPDSNEQHVAASPEVAVAAPPATMPAAVAERSRAKVADTMRVDVDRLDNLMNLTGELVLNRSRLVQIAEQVGPQFHKTGMLNRLRDFIEVLRETLEGDANATAGERSAQSQRLRSGLQLLSEQSEFWQHSRQQFGQLREVIDQLSRISQNLQRGVLETRMVPVGPLFQRFRRVVRDLAKERDKRVKLLIRGEKTELDKRMIDELGDPLVHLVRNSIDHGLETGEVRVSRGKPEMGTIFLEASHSGNNVFVRVRDDGGGIDAAKIKSRLVDRRILPAAVVEQLSDEQALDYIWHPGFSTATELTDVSGRGVGMDIVKTRISQLNGTIEVESKAHEGTSFTLRLPLTLAIIDSLLVRVHQVVFSVPIDDVREIVSLQESDIVTVLGKQTFDVRGEFIPLLRVDEIFHWHNIDYGYNQEPTLPSEPSTSVVVLHAAGKTVGLRVDELLGSQDIVIKSLSDNFINIRGLSGASILGDGSVCLMLDVGGVMDAVARPAAQQPNQGLAT